jgi:tripartite-type tricarboxylate transporter receptor subunit TctC
VADVLFNEVKADFRRGLGNALTASRRRHDQQKPGIFREEPLMKRTNRDRAVALAFVVALACCAGPSRVFAQPYPSQTVTIVVPFLAGGAVDVMARIIAARLQDYWKHAVVVENKPGGGGNIGSNSVAVAPADGYRLLFAPHGPVSYNVSLYKNMPYDPAKAFVPITLVGRSPNFLIVSHQSPFNSLSDIVAAAKAQPGKVTYASQGVGTTPHLTGARLGGEAKVEIVHVPYRGFPPAIADLISGRVTFMFADSGNTLPQHENKQVRILAIASDKRWPSFPDVKTMSELGYPGFVSGVWYAMLAPANTPPAITEKIRSDVLRAVKDPETSGKVQRLAVEIVGSTSAESRQILAAETAKWSEVIRSTGVTVE